MRHVRVQFRWYRCLCVELLFALAPVIYHYQGLFMLAFPTLTMGKKAIILARKAFSVTVHMRFDLVADTRVKRL